MDEDIMNTAMPDGEQNGQREEETAAGAAGADEAGRETEREGGQETSEETVAAQEAAEQDPGKDSVEESAQEEAAGDSEGKENPEQETAADAAEEEISAEEQPKKKEKRGMFRSSKELQKKDQEIAELKDQLLRARAEFENFRKRTDKEKAVRFDDGAMFILQKLLPVVDNFERGLAQVPEEAKDDPYVTGLEKIYKQLTVMLQESSVTPIEAVGKPFDPELHNAVMHVEDEELDENVVAEEFQKGYSYKDRVLRHSMVKVAN